MGKAANRNKAVAGGVWTKREPPTIEEALFAAAGIADDPEAQIDIAASLIGRPVDEVRQVARRMATRQAITVERPRLALHRPDGERRAPAAPRTVIVERVRTRAFRMA